MKTKKDKYYNVYGIDIEGKWIDTRKVLQGMVEATPKEVEEALIKEAKRRYKKGVTLKCLHNASNQEITSNKVFSWDGGCLRYGYTKGCGVMCLFDRNGTWATIIEEPKVIINGYEMKQEGDVISFGCAKFNKEFFTRLSNNINICNNEPNEFHLKHRGIAQDNNRKISSIKLDSGVELTVEDLKKIVDNLE